MISSYNRFLYLKIDRPRSRNKLKVTFPNSKSITGYAFILNSDSFLSISYSRSSGRQSSLPDKPVSRAVGALPAIFLTSQNLLSWWLFPFMQCYFFGIICPSSPGRAQVVLSARTPSARCWKNICRRARTDIRKNSICMKGNSHQDRRFWPGQEYRGQCRLRGLLAYQKAALSAELRLYEMLRKESLLSITHIL